jgi:hypothetical protein
MMKVNIANDYIDWIPAEQLRVGDAAYFVEACAGGEMRIRDIVLLKISDGELLSLNTCLRHNIKEFTDDNHKVQRLLKGTKIILTQE